MKICSVILAGGGGTRFWPLSRQCRPKQLLNLSGNDAMMNETIKRNLSVIPLKNTYVVTTCSQGDSVRHILLEGIPRENILVEPSGRNTAACIAYAASKIDHLYGDSVLCIFPSDAYINKEEEYLAALDKAIRHSLENDVLVTLGIYPAFAATGYGYIKYDRSDGQDGVFSVEEFVEKPNPEKAKQYLQSGCYLWNSGILVCRSGMLLENIKRFLPRLYKQIEVLRASYGTGEEQEKLHSVYPLLQSISIDCGILERSDDVRVVAGDFGWNDVGSWDMLGVVIPPDEAGNIIKAEHIGIDTKNTVVYGDHLIATIGIENMIIVNTDDALLICPKNRAQEVKDIVELIRKSGKENFL